MKNDHLARRNVAILAVCQALLNSTLTISISLGGLVGFNLASDKSLATLPVTAVVTGTAIATIPASMLMKRIGRRAGFSVGTLIGVAGALLAALAIAQVDFWLFCLSMLLVGSFSAFGQYYRFAAADVASDSFRPRAISLVMAGGVVAGFLGPQIAKWTKDLVPDALFLGCYVAAAGLCLVALVLLQGINIPRPTAMELKLPERPLGRVMRQPTFVVAACSAMIAYAMMNLLMTATPLAMVGHHHSTDDALTVIQWHVIGMFAPSFVTGGLIQRFGVLTIILAGVALNLLAISIALSGTGWLHFLVALTLLGIGWNFMFVGGTTLLTSTHNAVEKAKTQAANDFMVFGAVATASLLSGHLLHHFGWETINWAAAPFILASGALVVWYLLGRRAAARASAAD
ncbi:MAG: MFS transporter [Alphaproteobacteria bacterium]|nr:MFS transporter [Alphaproteobacteria bacterium]